MAKLPRDTRTKLIELILVVVEICRLIRVHAYVDRLESQNDAKWLIRCLGP